MMKVLVISALALTALCGVAAAQPLPVGRVYTFHSAAKGTCPPLDWHMVVDEGGVLNGMISWNNMQSMARATGTVNNGVFKMTAIEEAGPNPGRTATITGNVNTGDGWLTANIDGPQVKCDNIHVPWFSPPPSSQ